jgi:hypothetical protein
VLECGLDLSGRGSGAAVRFCEQRNGHLGFTKGGEFLVKFKHALSFLAGTIMGLRGI